MNYYSLFFARIILFSFINLYVVNKIIPKGKDAQTGYQYEPWHLRYLGIDMATKVYNSGLSLEEYLGITSEYAD